MENPNFLKQKYNLHNTPEVESAAKRTEVRSGEKVLQKPEARIENYLNRFHEITDREDSNEREMGIRALKKVILDKFVTKYEEIPESWHNLNERIIRERGQGGDWDKYSQEDKEKERRNQSEAVLSDQEASLEQWIDYLAAGDSSYMPDYIKYWVFKGVTELQEYDKEKNEFPKRSKGTVKMFPDINQEALAYVVDAVIKKQGGEEFKFDKFEADLNYNQKETFKSCLANENFSKLYAWANEQIHPIAKHLLPITEGEWIKYEQDSNEDDNENKTENYKKLNKSIRGRGTGWCTAGENTAKKQLEGGDFYCYYTLGDEKKATIPRIAIRMEKGKIGEIRGIANRQNLDPYMGDVLVKKLDEFPDKDEYLKKEADMKKLTEIDNKIKRNEPLVKDDLLFIYEINSKISGFGYEPDPRIKEIIETRNQKEDAPIIFECQPEQIAYGREEYEQVVKDNKIVKAYVGPLFSGIFSLELEHIYTNFPEGRIERAEMTIGRKTKEDIIQELYQRAKLDNSEEKIYFTGYAQSLMDNPEFTITEKLEQIDLVRLKVRDLGFLKGAAVQEIYAKAEELGLELCPPEVGPSLRLEYEKVFKREEPRGIWLNIGMKQINDSDDDPNTFSINRSFGKRWLGSNRAEYSGRWGSKAEFIFCTRKLES